MARILHIDDEPDRTKAFRDYLIQYCAHEVDLAGTSKEGIRKLQESSYGLILADVMFALEEEEEAANKDIHPLEMGLALIEMIKDNKFLKNPAQTPILVLSANKNARVENRIRALGVTDILPKWVDLDELSEKINELLTPKATD